MIDQGQIDAALTALGFPPPPASLRDVQAIVAEEMGFHRCTVRVRLDGAKCVVEVPAEDVDDMRRDRAPMAASRALRSAAKAGASEIEIVAVKARDHGHA